MLGCNAGWPRCTLTAVRCVNTATPPERSLLLRVSLGASLRPIYA